MIDCHNHLQQFSEPEEIFTQSQQAGVCHMVVNGTSELDWQSVAEISRRHRTSVTPAFGLHPWFIAQRSADWLPRLRTFLEEHPQAILGECGLDRWKKPFDLADQIVCLAQQLRLATELRRPLTLHCLEAWGPLLSQLEQAAELPPFLLHSYGGSREMVPRFLELGAYFSFSGYFLHPRKQANRETFRTIPAERLLLESDAPAMTPPPHHRVFELPDEQNHPANLAKILPALAELRETSPSQMAEQLAANSEEFLRMKSI